MLTVRQLVESTKVLRQRFNRTGAMSISKLAPVPVAQAFAVQARFRSLSDPHQQYYDTTLVLHGIEFIDQKDDTHPLGIEVTPGRSMFFPRPTMNSPVQVSCMCMDWYFVWQYYSDRAGSMAYNYWPGIQYRRKTPPPPYGRPWANPAKVPGICKHMSSLILVMSQKGFLVNS